MIDNPAAGVRLIDTSQPHPGRKPYDCLFSAEPPPDHDRDQPRRQVGRLRRLEGVGHHALGPPGPPAGPDPQRERRTGQQHLLRRLQPRWKKDGFKLNDCCDRLFSLGSWHMEECAVAFRAKLRGPPRPHIHCRRHGHRPGCFPDTGSAFGCGDRAHPCQSLEPLVTQLDTHRFQPRRRR